MGIVKASVFAKGLKGWGWIGRAQKNLGAVKSICMMLCDKYMSLCIYQGHWKRPWCWERLKSREGDDRGWDGWMALPTQQTWFWASSGSWWWTGKTGMLQSMGSQRVRHNWATELMHIYKPIENVKHQEWTLRVNYSLWVMMICQCSGPIVTNVPLCGRCWEWGKSCKCGTRGIREISVCSSQSCYESTTALGYQSIFRNRIKSKPRQNKMTIEYGHHWPIIAMWIFYKDKTFLLRSS